MKTCEQCKYALWDKTKVGRLHPLKGGQCTYKIKVPALPGAYYWPSFSDPTPCGGYIERGKELKDHCAYWSDGR